MEERWKESSAAIQPASHVGVTQIVALLEDRGSEAVAIAGGARTKSKH